MSHTTFYNPYTSGFSDEPNPAFNYGTRHDAFTPVSCNNVIPDGQFCTRNFSSTMYINNVLSDNYNIFSNATHLWPTAEPIDYSIVFMLANMLLHSKSFEDTTFVLVTLMGAWDSGYSYGGDRCFIYEMSVFPVQIEFYVSPLDGSISEIRRFNHEKNQEIYLPIHHETGIAFAVLQAYMNINQVNFDMRKVDAKLLKVAKEYGKSAIQESSHENLINLLRFDKLKDNDNRFSLLVLLNIYINVWQI